MQTALIHKESREIPREQLPEGAANFVNYLTRTYCGSKDLGKFAPNYFAIRPSKEIPLMELENDGCLKDTTNGDLSEIMLIDNRQRYMVGGRFESKNDFGLFAGYHLATISLDLDGKLIKTKIREQEYSATGNPLLSFVPVVNRTTTTRFDYHPNKDLVSRALQTIGFTGPQSDTHAAFISRTFSSTNTNEFIARKLIKATPLLKDTVLPGLFAPTKRKDFFLLINNSLFKLDYPEFESGIQHLKAYEPNITYLDRKPETLYLPPLK